MDAELENSIEKKNPYTKSSKKSSPIETKK